MHVDDGGALTTDDLIIAGSSSVDSSGKIHTNTTSLSGILSLNGKLSSPAVTITNPGVLSGNGIISGNVTNSGTITPGNSIGTLVVNGDVTFNSGSIFEVEIAGSSSDRLVVNGTANINGGNVVTAGIAKRLYSNDERWKIITATNGVNGKFDGVSGFPRSATLDFGIGYTSNSVEISVIRTPYQTFGKSENDKAVGGAFDALLPFATKSLEQLMISMDFDLSANQLSSVLHSFNPEMYSHFPAAGFTVANSFDTVAAQYQQEYRLLHTNKNVEELSMWNVWTKLLGSQSNQNTLDDIAGYDIGSTGTVFGVDRNFNPTTRFGLMLGYSTNNLDWEEGSSGTMDAKHIAFYGSAELGGFYLNARAGYTSIDNSANRRLVSPLLNDVHSASFDSDVLGGTVGAGYDFRGVSFSIGPIASMGYYYLSQEKIRESGNSLTQIIEDVFGKSFYSTLGLKTSGLISSGNWNFLPRVTVRWLHQFEAEAVSMDASFTGYSDQQFTIISMEKDADQLAASAGISVEYGECLNIFADYGFTGSKNNNNHLVSLGILYQF